MKQPAEAQQPGDAIRDMLKWADVTQRRFAERMGVDESTLCRLLKGKLRGSRLMVMAAFGAAMSIRQEQRKALGL